MPEPIEVTFLGTGSAIPSVHRQQAAVILKFGGDYLLFDCGEGAQLQLQKARISPMRISRIFISHWHADHFAGLLPLIETLHLSKRKEPLEIYGPEASRFVDALTELSYWGIGFEIKAVDVSPQTRKERLVEAANYEVSAIRTKHSVPSFGYLFREHDHWKIDAAKARRLGLEGKALREIKLKKKLVVKGKVVKLTDIAVLRPGRRVIYSGDTMVAETLFKEAEGVDLLIHDGTFIEPDPVKPHAAATEVAKLAKERKVKQLIITHISRKYLDTKEFSAAVKAILPSAVIAEDLMRVRL